MKGSKEMKKFKKLTIILTIVLLCLVSFIGIYIPKHSIMRNIIKEYDFAMNLGGYREVRMQVKEAEEGKEKQEVTAEKVEQVKNIIEKRLKGFDAQGFLIRADYTTGEIVLELEETTHTDRIIADIYTSGVLKMVDSENHDEALISNEHIEKVSTLYNTSEGKTTIYVDFKFTEEGAKLIENLSSDKYKTIEKEETKDESDQTTTEDADKKEEVKQPKLALMIDETELVSSSFDYPITSGRLQLSLNTATTDTKKIEEAVGHGIAIAAILNNGALPLEYTITGNTYIASEITNEMKIAFTIAIAIVILIAFVILAIKYKMPAVLAGISYAGFTALYLLALRYANVTISLEGVAGILIVLIINYILMQKVLANASITEAFKEMAIQSIPVIFVILAFTFIGWTNIASFGMTMFWGIVLTVLYNITVTKALLKK